MPTYLAGGHTKNTSDPNAVALERIRQRTLDEDAVARQGREQKSGSELDAAMSGAGQTAPGATWQGATAGDTPEQQQMRAYAMEKAARDERAGVRGENVAANMNYEQRRRQLPGMPTGNNGDLLPAPRFDKSTERTLNLAAQGAVVPDVEQAQKFDVAKAAQAAKAKLAQSVVESRGLAVGAAAGNQNATPESVSAAASQFPDATDDGADSEPDADADEKGAGVPANAAPTKKLVSPAHIAQQTMIMDQSGLTDQHRRKLKALNDAVEAGTAQVPELMSALDKWRSDLIARGIPEGAAKKIIASKLSAMSFSKKAVQSDIGPFPRHALSSGPAQVDIAPSVADQLAQAGYAP